MKDQLKRILNLVRKTGDTMIVTDPNGDDVYVVMGLDQYENILNDTNFDRSEDVLDEPEGYRHNIPQENGWVWGGETIDEVSENEELIEKKADIWSTMKPAGDESETWDLAHLSEDEVVDLEEQYKKYTQEPELPHVPEANLEAENKEISPKLEENEDEFGEEQFYLEPIE
ncbi:MAG: hypothetical protein ACD_65C00234G0001 [uncultured bacterium]|nr:MAG: hypothetical protein ACD_65C00234G0001 [uncultured bacterium]